MKQSINESATVSTTFNNLLTAEISSLKNFAKKFTLDSQDIDDLVQDTLIKAIHYFEKFEAGTNLKAWLYVIMRNTYINNYRRMVLRRNIVDLKEEITVEPNGLTPAINNGESKLINKDITIALKKLPPDLYIPFKMYIEGYKYYEIASQIGVSIGTVKTRMYNGRIKLKRMLKEYQYN